MMAHRSLEGRELLSAIKAVDLELKPSFQNNRVEGLQIEMRILLPAAI